MSPRKGKASASEPSLSPEIELVLRVLEGIRGDIGPEAEPNTSLLLYTLLQTPGTLAHGILGELDVALRARLVVESWHASQGRHFGISLDHIRYAARRIAVDACKDAVIDSRHLLLVCLVGSGFLANLPELRVLSTESRDILGRSNLAVKALKYSGADPLSFLERVRARPRRSAAGRKLSFPGFFVLWQQPDRTRVLRVEEVGEFAHQMPPSIELLPATLGLLDRSVGKSLATVLQFEDLLNNSDVPERQFQKFFESHPEFLLTDEHLAVRPGVLLSSEEGLGLKPDFFLQRRDVPLWDIAELKLPSVKLLQGRPARRGLAAAVHWGLDQLRRYREYFLDPQLARRFRDAHGMELYFPRLTLIIGRDAAFGTYHERQRLTPPEARILTYDDLLRFAKHRSLVLPFTDRSRQSP